VSAPSSSPLSKVDLEKHAAALKSLEFVAEGMTLGLGSGSTAAIMIDLLGDRVRQGLRVRGVPTSVRTRQLAEAAGIPLTSFEEVTRLDLTIDGADEVDSELHLIKGGGGALLHEKIVASASHCVLIIVDSSKLVNRLGAFPLPIEVIPFACRLIADRLREQGILSALRTTDFDQPLITDEGNYILDCAMGEIDDPPALARALEAMPGVVEHGLFVNVADKVIVGHGERTTILER
jgi:ribose 5-phosphate isomerase A